MKQTKNTCSNTTAERVKKTLPRAYLYVKTCISIVITAANTIPAWYILFIHDLYSGCLTSIWPVHIILPFPPPSLVVHLLNYFSCAIYHFANFHSNIEIFHSLAENSHHCYSEWFCICQIDFFSAILLEHVRVAQIYSDKSTLIVSSVRVMYFILKKIVFRTGNNTFTSTLVCV